jgi:hypothetical protein
VAGDALAPVGAAVAAGFTFAFASAAAFLAAAFGGSGAAALAGVDVFSNSRRKAESGAPRCA